MTTPQNDVKAGDRIMLRSMPEDPAPLPAGSTGTVRAVTQGQFAQIQVVWDSGSNLSLIPGVDHFEVLSPDSKE